MKIQTLCFGLLLLTSIVSAQNPLRVSLQEIDQEDYDTIYNEAFERGQRSLITGDDANITLKNVVKAIFKRNKVLFILFV